MVQQNIIRQFIKLTDSRGVELEDERSIQETASTIQKGPNGLWHMDFFDKLKLYRMGMFVWMEAHMKNNYLNVVAHFGGCSKGMCADHGTENSHVPNMQVFVFFFCFF